MDIDFGRDELSVASPLSSVILDDVQDYDKVSLLDSSVRHLIGQVGQVFRNLPPRAKRLFVSLLNKELVLPRLKLKSEQEVAEAISKNSELAKRHFQMTSDLPNEALLCKLREFIVIQLENFSSDNVSSDYYHFSTLYISVPLRHKPICLFPNLYLMWKALLIENNYSSTDHFRKVNENTKGWFTSLVKQLSADKFATIKFVSSDNKNMLIRAEVSDVSARLASKRPLESVQNSHKESSG